MAAAEHKSDTELTKDTPYLALMGELWSVCFEDLGENWQRYNSTALYKEVYQYFFLYGYIPFLDTMKYTPC